MATGLSALTTGGTPLAVFLTFIASAAAQTTSPALTTLYSFAQDPNDGSNPNAIVIGSGGVLYGTTEFGGTARLGAVFALTPPASPGGPWSETVLYSFMGVSDGVQPNSLTIGPGGVLYGTSGGGSLNFGAVFALVPPALPAGRWSKIVLHTFAGGPTDGAGPSALATGRDGVLYGTTLSGGTGSCDLGCGTVFSLRPPLSAGQAWSETILYFGNFAGGSIPVGVVIGGDGVLYGATYEDGTGAAGTLFSLTPPVSAGGPWSQAVLHDFAGGGDGVKPYANVVIGSGGTLYGTTEFGGTQGHGTVFSLTPPTSPGGPWTETVLNSFPSHNHDGGGPIVGVVIGRGGVLYGATPYGGSSLGGTVFALTPPASPGGPWSETVLYDFSGVPNGNKPDALAISRDGVVYGATYFGGIASCARSGSLGCGTVFSLKP